MLLLALALCGLRPPQVSAWQAPAASFSNPATAIADEPAAFNAHPQYPIAPATPSLPRTGIILPAEERMLTADYVARRVAEEPEPVRMPKPTFLQASYAQVPNAAGSNGERVLAGEPLPDEEIGLATPSDSRQRRGYLARVFGPGIEAGGEMLSDIRCDYRNFYSRRSLLWLGAGVGVAAVLANTKIDQHFQNWYQDDVRSPATDRIHDTFAGLGNGGIMVPIWLGTGFLLTPLEEYSPTAHIVGTWGRNSTRAFVVGAPMLIALQYGLGAHRPSADINSYWHPFQDSHGASGDAWIGAISCFTAAKMTDSKLAKVALWTLALFPAYGRLDVNQHYLSQVTLGVWLAALSVEAVDMTDRSSHVFIIPSAGPGTVGTTIGFKW